MEKYAKNKESGQAPLTKCNLNAFKIENNTALKNLEKEYRDINAHDYIPWANNTPFEEIANVICTDVNGKWNTPLTYYISEHNSTIGINNLLMQAYNFLKKESQNTPMDILSITGRMKNNKISLHCLLRVYNDNFNFAKFFNVTGDDLVEYVEQKEEKTTGELIIPKSIKEFSYTETEIELHDIKYEEQQRIYNECTKEKPFLNQLESYTPKKLWRPEDSTDLIYDLVTKDKKQKTVAPYEVFNQMFREIMTYVNGVEYYHYINAVQNENSKEFMVFLEDHIKRTYIDGEKNTSGLYLDAEDLPIMMDKLYRALFQLYVVQDLIDDPNVTDIKITAYNSIRARIKGKAYISNITFIDTADYKRFINAICIRNRVLQNVPEQTFTDNYDKNYILRFSLTSEYVNSVDYPYLHIRKIDRNKPLAKELIEAGMFDEKLKNYLLDCGRNSRGVVFAGPPGSGKTVCLNWFLEEAYEQSAEILVIQENDELFAYRKGVMFQHVVNYPQEDQEAVTLEELGRLALVAGANVFIIGEAKGAEICSAMTLSNSGCRTAITIHSNSSTDTIEKMADLAMRGYAKDIIQAKRMLRSFQTVVYLENFKIKEISEIIGFNDETQDMEYRYIYRREE